MQTYTDGKCIHVPREYLVIGVLTLYNKMSPTGGCHQTVHYDSYTDHRGVEPVRQRESELTAAEAARSQLWSNRVKYLSPKLQHSEETNIVTRKKDKIGIFSV